MESKQRSHQKIKAFVIKEDQDPESELTVKGFLEMPDPKVFSRFMKSVYNTANPTAPETVHDKKMKVFEKIPGYVHPKELKSKVIDARRILFLEKIEAEEREKHNPQTPRNESAGIDPFSRVASRDEETMRIYLLLKDLPQNQQTPSNLMKLKLPKIRTESSRVDYSKAQDSVVETIPSTQRTRQLEKSIIHTYGDESKYCKSVSRIKGLAQTLLENHKERQQRVNAQRKRKLEAERLPSPEEVHQRALEKRYHTEAEDSVSQQLQDDSHGFSSDYFEPYEEKIKKKLFVDVKEIQKELQRIRLQHIMARDKEEAAKIIAARDKPPPPELFEQHVKEIKKVLRSRRLQSKDEYLVDDEEKIQKEEYQKRMKFLMQKEGEAKTSAEIVHRLIEDRICRDSRRSMSDRTLKSTPGKPTLVPISTPTNRVTAAKSIGSNVRIEIMPIDELSKQTDKLASEQCSPAKVISQQTASQQTVNNTAPSIRAFKDRISETLSMLDKKQRANMREKIKVERVARTIKRELGVFNRIKFDEFVKGCEDLEIMGGMRTSALKY
jgi:hypothetical protein